MDGKREGRRRKSSSKKVLLAVLMVILCAAAAAALWKWGGGAGPGDAPNGTSGDSSAGDQTVQESPSGEAETPNVVITDKKQASYEEWLAAGMVVAVSMQYPEFELKGIYLTGETELTDKETSSGAYVVFEADGTRQAVHSFPLDGNGRRRGPRICTPGIWALRPLNRWRPGPSIQQPAGR